MPRGCGKTFQLIKMSHESGNYIVCHSMQEADRIHQEARDLGFSIPLPITYDEFIKRKYNGKGIKAFLIDNVELLLDTISTIPINAITMNP